MSNHGGRQLDTAPAAIEVLPEIHKTVQSLNPAFPVYVDGGIRRGTDVFKAIALGADGVLVGRPCIYGLAVDGYPGVAQGPDHTQGRVCTDHEACWLQVAG